MVYISVYVIFLGYCDPSYLVRQVFLLVLSICSFNRAFKFQQQYPLESQNCHYYLQVACLYLAQTNQNPQYAL